MALHKDFPKDPYAILDPNIRWFPADEDLREKGAIQKLMPPLVAGLREKVKEWRDKNYDGASDTSKALLNWWFKEEHIIYNADGTSYNFRYYFAQREALETVIWLYEVAKVKDKYDLIRYNATGVLSPQMFTEEWLRFVIKMATGAGKTKVMSLIVAWAYFHKKYEQDSGLAKNFLLITRESLSLSMSDEDTSQASAPPPEVAPEAPQGATSEPAQPVSGPVAPEATAKTPTAQITLNEPLAPEPDPIKSTPSEFAQSAPATTSVTMHGSRELMAQARAEVQNRKQKKLEKIMIALNSKKQITNDEVEKLLHVSDATATRYLSALEKAGKIKQGGKTGHYVAYTRI